MSYTVKDTTSPLELEQIVSFVKEYLTSSDRTKLEILEEYYEAENPAIYRRYNNAAQRNKTPNIAIPTPYYSTVIDSMAGFLFSNVLYTPKTANDKLYAVEINDILDNNDVKVLDMETGVNSLTYNLGAELVYTTKEADGIKIKVCSLDPDELIFVYDSSIDSKLFCAIRIIKADDKEYNLDVIYANMWQKYSMNRSSYKLEFLSEQKLLFLECPVIEYNTNSITDDAPFQSIIPYIDALDVLVSNNNEELHKLADAILVIGKKLKPEDIDRLGDIKVLMDMSQEERAEYLERNISPAFREYLSKLLIEEIFRHSHIVDWYNSQNGLSGAASGKALRIRLHDMSVYAARLENVYRKGAYKRIRLITQIMSLLGKPTGFINIEFKRTLPNDMDEMILAINTADYLSKETKVRILGLDWEIEEQRLLKQNNTIQPTSPVV